jgi:hypothetical protein
MKLWVSGMMPKLKLGKICLISKHLFNKNPFKIFSMKYKNPSNPEIELNNQSNKLMIILRYLLTYQKTARLLKI